MLRLLRIMKLLQVFHQVQNAIYNELLAICWNIAKHILAVILSTHLISCTWYYIGILGEEEGGEQLSWVLENRMEERALRYRYATSLHRAVMQLHGTM